MIEKVRLAIAPVWLRYDVSHASSRVLVLGVFGQLTAPGVRGLGLIARTSLTAAETKGLSYLVAEQAQKPFDFLAPSFEGAWEKLQCDPGLALPFLAERHSAAISLQAPKVVEEPAWRVVKGRPYNPRDVTVQSALESYFVRELDHVFLNEVWDETNTFDQFADRSNASPKRRRIDIVDDDDLIAA